MQLVKSLITVPGLVCCSVIVACASIYKDGWIDLNKNGRKDRYEDPAQPVDRRVTDLVGRMTLDEKLGQLQQAWREQGTEDTFRDQLRQGKIGSFLAGDEVIETPFARNRLQRIAVEESRLGIPLIFGHDVIHGFRTIFPIPLALACAWEPELLERVQAVAAREAAAAGVDWTFAPMVDLARDPRWGRIAEGFGEDPYLGALYAAASVRGFQGTNPAAPDRLVACLKHYVGYGAAEGGRDYNTTEISEFTLRNFYLPAFNAGVEAGAWTVMSAFNCLSGFPASANRHTLTEILRHEWKFPGFVVSDWAAVEELIPHGVAADKVEAARLALHAGVDMEMVSTAFAQTLKRQIQEGKVPEALLDQAVRRILRVKFVKGLFDKPYVDETRHKDAFLCPDAIALAREAAVKSCVLLKNDGILPLSKRLKHIALIGPLASEKAELLGCWASRGHPEDVVSLAEGVRAKLGPDARLTVLPGCSLFPTNTDEAQIQQAAAAAAGADAVVLAVGEPRDWTGESASRAELGLTGRQTELFDAIVATGKPVVVVLFNGRPLTIAHVVTNAAAVLEAWHPGVQGGNAIADILFGDAAPSGRLTASFPWCVGQVPIYYNHFNTGRPGPGKFRSNYLDTPLAPLFPFGFGLTYTSFEYGAVTLSTHRVKLGGSLVAQVDVKNVGTRAGTEVVQLYIRDVAATAGPRPVRELRGFKKVHLQPGEERKVEFLVTVRELGYFDASGRWRIEPGKFQLWLSKDAVSGEPVEFELAE